MEKNKSKQFKGVVIALILLFTVFTASVFYNEKQNSKYLLEARQYADSLNYLKKVEQGSRYLLAGEMINALATFEQADSMQNYAQSWGVKVRGLTENNGRFTRKYDSLQIKLRIAQNAVLSKQSIIALLDQQNNAFCYAGDSLRVLLAEALDRINDSNTLLENLQAEVALLKSSHGKIEFFVDNVSVTYYGDLVDDEANGFGFGVFQSKGIYIGEWKNNKRHGRGRYTWANGDTYDGEFVNGKREGEGIYLFSSGEKYVGQWKEDLRNGTGVMYSKENQILLNGTWVKDHFNKAPENEDNI